jgi:hypothetical protein
MDLCEAQIGAVVVSAISGKLNGLSAPELLAQVNFDEVLEIYDTPADACS